MTVFKLIEGIYNKYGSRHLSKARQQALLNDIRIAIKKQWPEIEHVKCVYISEIGTLFNVMLRKKLMKEFIEKYPDALV